MLAVMVPSLGGWLMAAAEVRWTAPAGCPTQVVVQERIEDLVGDGALRPDVVADARVRASEEGWALRLALRTADRTSTRHMAARECQTLADAVALVVATFVDPVQTDRRATGRMPAQPRAIPAPPARPAAPAKPAAPAGLAAPAGPTLRPRETRAEAEPTPEPPPPRPTPRDPDLAGVRLAAIAGRATQHDLDLGPDVELSWQRGVVRLGLGALALVPRDRPVTAGVTLRRWMLAGRLRAGVVMPLSPRVELPLSLGVEVGPVVARGRGVDRPQTVVSPWLAAVGSVQVVWRLRPRWGLWAGIDGIVGALLPRFTVDGAGPIASGPGGIRAALGVEWRWEVVRG